MKKHELISDTAELCGQPKSVVRLVLDAAAEAVKFALGRGDDVFLFGLGKLHTSRRAEKKARNIWTGEPVTVPERTVILFKPSESLTSSANET